jgi:hypothetical protein
MWKDNKGMTLIDAILGTSLLIVFISLAFPIITILVSERNHLEEKSVALTKMDNHLQAWLYGELSKSNLPKSIKVGNNAYQLQWEQTNNKMKVCLVWLVSPSREERLCSYGKKPRQ